MRFSEALKKEENWTTTTNGQAALKSTGDACLDLFSQIGALRDANDSRLFRLFAEAYKENPLAATKIVFYGRDIRGGLGERSVPRKLFRYMAENHPESIKPNISLIGTFGRFDDLYSLIGTPVEADMWRFMKIQLEADIESDNIGKPVSLLAKWIKTPDASSKQTRNLGILTAKKLGYSVYDFKRILRKLRKNIDIVERKMSNGEWDQIDYSVVPSRAMHIYGKAFERHDSDGFNDFIGKAVKGEVKINSNTVYPYDLVHKIFGRTSGLWSYRYAAKEDAVVEAQWRALPNYVENANALVIVDTSGSMGCDGGRPIETALSLGVYFAERNTGEFHNMFMMFNDYSTICKIKGKTLAQKINSIDPKGWGSSTNLEAAFDNILSIAVDYKVPQEDMPKALVVISDMQINGCCSRRWTFYDEMKARYAQYGYNLPNIVFWNVNSVKDTFHADKERKGVQLVSGSSPVTFKHVLECIGYNPVEAMEKIINSERYEPITIAE